MSAPKVSEAASLILNSKSFAHLATMGTDGMLHSSPVWFDWDGNEILISQTTSRQKYKNVTQNPVVAISVLDPENPYNYVEIRGKVTSITDDPDFSFIDKMAKKYIDEDHYPWHQPGDKRVILHITPDRVLGR